jgi:hypothetical protein
MKTAINFCAAVNHVGLLLLPCFFSLGGIPPISAATLPESWPFRDGSVTIRDNGGAVEFAFSFVPFLGISPAWTPAYPKPWGHQAEAVRPLAGLGGKMRIGIAPESGEFVPFQTKDLDWTRRTPYSAACRVNLPDGSGTLEWTVPPDLKGSVFRYSETGGATCALRFEIDGFPQRTIWATPGKKQRYDWGESRWELDRDGGFLTHTYATPIDATHSPATALWFGKGVNVTSSDLSASESSTWKGVHLSLEASPGGPIAFGFLHEDSLASLQKSVARLQEGGDVFAQSDADWRTWIREQAKSINSKFRKEILPTDATVGTVLSATERLMADNLVFTRLLFLSNGGVLSRPMTLDSFPLSVRDQGVALNHWRSLGIEFPYLGRWRDLARYNPCSERSLPIRVFSGDRVRDLFGKGKILLASPDPENPPEKESFDLLLGYVIAGGNLTLVDGVHGFEGTKGWWTEAGCRDPADYAIRVLGVPVDSASRAILDAETLARDMNTFCADSRLLKEGASKDFERHRFEAPSGGYLLLYPKISDSTSQVRLRTGRIGKEEFLPFTAAEDEVLAASHAPRVSFDSEGIPAGRLLQGESFAAYRLPGDATTVSCELELMGSWCVAWSENLPKTDHVLVKKAYQAWFMKELLEVPVSRLAHPVVYGATWSCRVFDVTPTETSPVLYHSIGKGTFVWVGLPKDYLLLGSDTGTDRQNWLRNDLSYDLLRMTLALHDSKRAGAQQASEPPACTWGEGWSQHLDDRYKPDLLYYAWLPTQILGPHGSGNALSSWALPTFRKSLEKPLRDGDSLSPGPAFVTSGQGGKPYLSLYSNACVYAIYKDMADFTKRKGLTWWSRTTESNAAKLERQLVDLFALESPSPMVGRAVAGGTAAEELPISQLFPEAVLAISEIPAGCFPGGATATQRILSSLAANADDSKDTRSLALLATKTADGRGRVLRRILPRDTGGVSFLPIGNEERSFDLATAVPALHALALEVAE